MNTFLSHYLCALLAMATCATATAQEVEQVKLLFSEPGIQEAERISLRIRALDDPDSRPTFTSVEPGERIELPLGRQEIAARVPGYWIQERTVVVQKAEDLSVEFQTRREGIISGGFSEQQDTSRFRIQLLPLQASDRELGEMIEVVCEPPVAGDFACGVPEGLFDVVVRPRGVVPHYRWDVAVRPGETTDLGNLKLVEGASVSGVVANAGDDTEATLFLMSDRRVSKTEAVLRNGFFQFSNVPPGHYLLEVRDGRHSPAAAGPIEVFESAESRLREPLQMLEAAGLQIAVTPPTDQTGALWKLLLTPEALAERRFQDLLHTIASPAGTAEFVELRPGEYRLTLVDGSGQELITRIVTLNEGESQLQTISYVPVRVQGRVLLGSEPVDAQLVFGGKFGTRRISVDTDDEGGFEAWLPEYGEWPVAVQVPAERISIDVEVEIEEDEDLEIVLPGGEISGTVLDHSGRPVALAKAVAVFESGSRTAITNPEGQFELKAVPAGDVRLGASVDREGQQLHTDLHHLSIGAEQSLSGVVLKMEDTRSLRIRVLYQTRPVANAWVRLVSPEGPFYTGRTDVDGRLEMDVDAGFSTGVAIIQGLGFGLAARPIVVADPDEVVRLQLTRETGTIEIVRPRPETGFREISSIRVGSLPLPVGDVLDWARKNASSLHAPVVVWPALEPGAYEVCAARSTELSPSVDCETAAVMAGSAVRISFEFDD